MNYFQSNAAEGFVPSHAPLKNNKHLNIPFQSTQPRRGKDKSELQSVPTKWGEGAGGHASILSVMPNVAPDNDYSTNFKNVLKTLKFLFMHLQWNEKI